MSQESKLSKDDELEQIADGFLVGLGDLSPIFKGPVRKTVSNFLNTATELAKTYKPTGVFVPEDKKAPSH